MQRLLASAVADPSVTVRRTILEALSCTTALESHLAQAECLRSLFVALNDESSHVRSLTIQLAGAISHTNPAYVMPALRRHLMQLLSDMDHSPDSRQREGTGGRVGGVGNVVTLCCPMRCATLLCAQCHLRHGTLCCPSPTAESARLLGVLIRSAPKLVLPYTAPVLRALISKLRAAGSTAAAAPSTTPAKPSTKSASQGGDAAWLGVAGTQVQRRPALGCDMACVQPLR